MTSSLFSDCHCPVRGGGGSQVAGAEALSVGFELVLFQVCALPSPRIGTFTPKGNSAGGRRARTEAWHGLEHGLAWSWNQLEF